MESNEEKMMLVRFGALKTWKRPTPGKVIGPQYCFEAINGRPHVMAKLSGLGTETFRVSLGQAKYHPNRRLRLYLPATRKKAATLEWHSFSACLQAIKITRERFRNSGLASVMCNILLRALFEEGVPLRNLFVDNMLGYNESDLNMIGLMGKFGINCSRAQDQQSAITHLRDPGNILSVDSVAGKPNELFLSLSIIGTRKRALQNTLKIFLLHRRNDNKLHERLSENRAEVERLIRAHKACISLNLFMDPRKAPVMEKYAAHLPQNIV